MIRNHLKSAVQKLSRRAAHDEAFAYEVRTGPAHFARSQLFAEMLDEDELRAVRAAMNYHWAPEVAAHSEKTRAAVKGVYGDAIRKVVEKCREDADFAYDVRTDPFGVLQGGRPHEEVGLTLEETRTLKDTSQELWQADVKVMLTDPVLQTTDLELLSTTRLQQLIGDCDVVGVGSTSYMHPTLAHPCGAATPPGLGTYCSGYYCGGGHEACGFNPTVTPTWHAYGVNGCGLGSSFEGVDDEGKPVAIFLFGDTVGFGSNDPIGFTRSTAADATPTDACVQMPCYRPGVTPVAGCEMTCTLQAGCTTQVKLEFFTSSIPAPGTSCKATQLPTLPDGSGEKTYTKLILPYSANAISFGNATTPRFLALDTTSAGVLAMKGDCIPFGGICLPQEDGSFRTFVSLILGVVTGPESCVNQNDTFSLLTEYTGATAAFGPSFFTPPGDRLPLVEEDGRKTVEFVTPISSTPRQDGGFFLKTQFHVVTIPPEGVPGLPEAEPGDAWVAMFGTGGTPQTRAIIEKCKRLGVPPPNGVQVGGLKLAMIPADDFPNIGNNIVPGAPTTYYAVTHSAGTVTWDVSEDQAKDLLDNPDVGAIAMFSIAEIVLPAKGRSDVSGCVTTTTSFTPRVPSLWVMLLGLETGDGIIQLQFALQPWGPWVGPIEVFQTVCGFSIPNQSSSSFPRCIPPVLQPGFIHSPSLGCDDSLRGPYIGGSDTPKKHGNSFAPMIVERFCTVTSQWDDGAQEAYMELRVVFALSTFVPYYVHLMEAKFRIEGDSLYDEHVSVHIGSGGCT